ncbi:hypothetical protein O4J56_19145 [Nocardiopsis sp. RSe5-2]|uniref:DUF4386 family protein n=1 Tax=Nocardiopsis endophytica TaxID=3018445 RepID=A0ABT4U750_9ACTN|nr:hypothetical protein [Nocardiopsis endophytica]MDA2812770.1 hypothetical protein [Nocardiopsis endophytica]
MERRRLLLLLAVLLVGGAAIGLASVGADRVPSTAWGDGGAEPPSLAVRLFFALVTFLDTYVGWSLGPFVLGYAVLGYGAVRSPVPPAAAGAGFAVAALGAYGVGSHFAQVADARAAAAFEAAGDVPPPPGPAPEPSLVGNVLGPALTPLLPAAVAGAVAVAVAAHYAGRFPALLLVPVGAVALDLWRRAPGPSQGIVNTVPDALLAATGIVLVVWTAAALLRRSRGDR